MGLDRENKLACEYLKIKFNVKQPALANIMRTRKIRNYVRLKDYICWLHKIYEQAQNKCVELRNKDVANILFPIDDEFRHQRAKKFIENLFATREKMMIKKEMVRKCIKIIKG